jgi:hypothetical protein
MKADRKKKPPGLCSEQHVTNWIEAIESGKVASELDAMASFLSMWAKDFADEGDFRMAMITSKVWALVTLLCLKEMGLTTKAKKKKQGGN